VAQTKEIRTKIKSIQSTRKITRAMEMVATSKMRRAQERMRASSPYIDKIRAVISHVAEGSLEYAHPYTIEREVKSVGYIVISTDRGLCGGLNVNLFKKIMSEMVPWHNKKVPVDVCFMGKKARTFFNRVGGCSIKGAKINLGDKPLLSDFIGLIKVMLDSYDNKSIDRLYIVHNEFINTMTQKPKVEMLLPVLSNSNKSNKSKALWDYIYEPDAQLLLDALMKRYIESLVYQGVVENIACEQAARMVAMKNASDNAGGLIEEFKLIYNKARQAAITQELSEIVAGAAAV